MGADITDSSPISIKNYSLANIEPAARYEHWLHRAWWDFAPLFYTRPSSEFAVETESVSLGGLSIGFTNLSAQTWTREHDLLRKHANDSLVVNISVDIRTDGRAGERAFNQRPGQALLGDLSQTSRHEVSTGRSIQLDIPREMASSAGLEVAEMHGLTLSASATSILKSHLLHLRQTLPFLMKADAQRAARTIVDILVLAANSTGRAEASVHRALAATLATRAHNDIRENLGSASLTVASLCRRLNVSRTTLYRLFESEGGPQAYIRNTRLIAAQLALDEPGNVEPISIIAERLGFADPAHFSRCFRDSYGESPRDYRARKSAV